MSLQRRATLMVLAVLTALAAPPSPNALAARRAGPARDVLTDAGAIRGPLSDFWFKVRSEWSGYLREDLSPAPGGGPVRERTHVTAPPNRAWVSLAYGDLANGPLAHLFDEFLSEYKKAEGRNWPYAQIYDRRWDRMGKQGRAQNMILIGTPWALPPVGPLAASLGFTIAPGRIEIGRRKYRGDNLILIFIAPNPIKTGKYSLVITGTNDEGLMQAGHLPYGETDYVLFRGRRLLESGHFAKKPGSPVWGPPDRLEAAGSHNGFVVRETEHYSFWYEPDRTPKEEVDVLAAEKEAAWSALESLTPERPGAPPRITYYLYSTVDRKIDETSRDEVVHVDLATAEIHGVFSHTDREVEPWLDLMVLLHHAIGPTRTPRLERALAIALSPEFQGREVGTMAARLFQDARGKNSAVLKSLRDQDVMTPADGPPAGHDLLLAAFLRHLVVQQGRERAFEFVSQASPRNLDEAFQQAYGVNLGTAIDDWGALTRSSFDQMARAPTPRAAPSADALASTASGEDYVARGLAHLRDREDVAAARLFGMALAAEPANPVALSSLARIRFRAGEFNEAERHAMAALQACQAAGTYAAACAETDAWSRLTLGRIEALRGRYVAARVELVHPAVKNGPAPVPTLADYWLDTMGQSRNQLTVISHLKREARVSLRNLDWGDAETDLKKALEIDPTDSESHELLSEVYHKQHEYWSWQIRFLNEIHPDYNVLGQFFLTEDGAPIVYRAELLHTIDSFNDLVLKGNLELMKAQSLYAVEIQNLHAEGERFLIKERDTSAALGTYLRALDLNKDFFLSNFLVGRCLFLMDRFPEAKQSFEEVLRRRPQDRTVLSWTYTYLGYIALTAEDLAAAKHAFEKALTQSGEGRSAALARDGLGRVNTIHLLNEKDPDRR